MLRGQFVLALPAAILAWLALGKAKSFSSILGGAGDKSSGQRSRVRTDMLEMELDHDTGEMSGVVLSGEFVGQELADLALEDLRQLYRECVTAGPQASALLEAYLDRTHPDWREGADMGGEGQEHGATGSSAMTREEAFEILGLPYGANESDIRQAHRSLMKKFPPRPGRFELSGQQDQPGQGPAAWSKR